MILLLAGLALGMPVGAQAPEDSILVDMKVNFGVAFRNASWVPIDVFVRNGERDVSGYVEIKTFDYNGQLQSPTYRVPAESPRHSQKRFRVYCRLEQVDRIEAQLYHGNRAALPGPTRLQINAIDPGDYLGLVLDDTHHDFGFLSDPRVIGRADGRFHREGLVTDQLGYLPDHLSCYTAFDLIVMGDIDPDAIDVAHRALLQEYVSLGGTLAICLGQNADRYRGTWVESLMGASIGANTFQSEVVLAQAALTPGAALDDVTENREGMVTALTPAAATVLPMGRGYRLGTIHPVGGGRVVTFTVDAVSGLLRHQDDFLLLWNRLLRQSIVDRPLNLNAVVEAASYSMPRIAGVRLFPVSSVIVYLLLYFFIAIVANWLFWDRMKRREMAWVCLVFFSLAFTSYAMIFGTQGRARSTQLEQLEILEMAAGNETARLHGVTGLLAKGSGRFNAVLPRPGTLLFDAARSNAIGVNQPGGIFGPQSQNAFHFLQAETGRVEGLTVGASEMRFIQTETPLSLDGAIEADLTVSGAGVQGTIVNQTGLPLVRPTLYYEGQTIPLVEQDGSYPVSMSFASGGRAVVLSQHSLPSIPTNHAMTTPDQTDQQVTAEFDGFLSGLPALMLHDAERATPPCLIAWVDAPPFRSVDMGDRATPHFGAILSVTWLPVTDERTAGAEPIDLPLRVAVSSFGRYVEDTYPGARLMGGPIAPDGSNWEGLSIPLYQDENPEFSLSVPEWARGEPDYGLEITVTTLPQAYRGDHKTRDCELARRDGGTNGLQLALLTADPREPAPLPVSGTRTQSVDYGAFTSMTVTVHHIDNWSDLALPRSTTVHFAATALDGDGKPLSSSAQRLRYIGGDSGSALHYHVHLSARLVKPDAETAGD